MGVKNPRRNGLFAVDVEICGLGRLGGGDDVDQTGCPPRRDRTKSPKLESGTDFSAAETGRRNGLIRLDCRNRDRANQRIWHTCLWECGAINGQRSKGIQSRQTAPRLAKARQSRAGPL